MTVLVTMYLKLGEEDAGKYAHVCSRTLLHFKAKHETPIECAHALQKGATEQGLSFTSEDLASFLHT